MARIGRREEPWQSGIALKRTPTRSASLDVAPWNVKSVPLAAGGVDYDSQLRSFRRQASVEAVDDLARGGICLQ